ncbi:MAG TPA: response regulator [Candidatus Sulfotelmatobacter sp.]
MARKILLADDSVTAQNMGRKILADAGYEVITVNNGSAALKKIAELKPELIILDIYMPGYSGLEVCQRLKDAPETARIPVLLTVGKLEPFKPDEAKRVRAEGYIVKPFEATELLSALSKLEDKIVPRAETGKPGRFGRSVAGIEDSNRTGEEPVAEGSWKNRISFPSKKKEAPQENVDDSALYNPVNRDLKTVVQSEEAKVKASPAQDAGLPEIEKSEERIDVAALAAPGLPKDVTTEEIAALAAAAAQVHARRVEVAKDLVSEIKAEVSDTGETAPPETANQAQAETNSVPVSTVSAGLPVGPTEAEVAAAIALLEHEEDAPMTMAASAPALNPQGVRWTAVSVAVDPQEAAISLEREMQQAFTAFARAAATQVGPATVSADSGVTEVSATPSEPVPEAITATHLSSSAQNVPELAPPVMEAAESSDASIAKGSDFAVAPAPEVSDDSRDTDHSASAQPEVEADPQITEYAEGSHSVIPAVALESANNSSDSPAALIAEPEQHHLETSDQQSLVISTIASSSEDISSRATSPDVSREAAPEAVYSEVAAEATVAEAEVVLAQAVSEETHAMPELAQEIPPQEAEVAATTAAAWASWRQIRDSIPKHPPAPTTESATEAQQSTPVLPPAAMAVAAGAEASPSDVSTPAAPVATVDAQTVASIVDSLLAELRPRMVEEISRKLASEKAAGKK